MNSEIKQWLRDNLLQRLRFDRDTQTWSLIFGATCLYLWLYRNGLVYGIDGVETWSVLAKVRGWYETIGAGEEREDVCVSAGARSTTIVQGSHGSTRDNPIRW
ncbi:hypothetical protein V6N13_059801 [Hibiscus sabdariffa]